MTTNLSPSEAKVLEAFRRMRREDGSWPGSKAVHEATGIPLGTISSCLHNLNRKGYDIHPTRRYDPPEFDPTPTTRQAEVLAWMTEYFDREGLMPTVRELAGHFNVHANGAMCHIRALIKKGYLRQARKNTARGYLLVKGGAA